MVRHAFEANPDQMPKVIEEQEAELLREFGLDRRWDMPVAEWLSPRIYDVPVPGFGHHTLCVNIDGAPVERRAPRDGRTWVAPGRIALMPSDAEVSYWKSEGPVRYCHFYMRCDLLARIALETTDIEIEGGLIFRDDCTSDRALQAMLGDYLVRAADRRMPATPLEMDSRALLVGLHLMRSYGTAPIAHRLTEASRSPIAPWRIKRVRAFIEAHLGAPLYLEDLAEVAGLSRFHFSRGFKATTGIGVHRYVQERRVARARERLIHGREPIARIALDCGFASQAHFTTVFRNTTGLTPGRFRAEFRRVAS